MRRRGTRGSLEDPSPPLSLRGSLEDPSPPLPLPPPQSNKRLQFITLPTSRLCYIHWGEMLMSLPSQHSIHICLFLQISELFLQQCLSMNGFMQTVEQPIFRVTKEDKLYLTPTLVDPNNSLTNHKSPIIHSPITNHK